MILKYTPSLDSVKNFLTNDATVGFAGIATVALITKKFISLVRENRALKQAAAAPKEAVVAQTPNIAAKKESVTFADPLTTEVTPVVDAKIGTIGNPIVVNPSDISSLKKTPSKVGTVAKTLLAVIASSAATAATVYGYRRYTAVAAK